jgi:hypothetical protein
MPSTVLARHGAHSTPGTREARPRRRSGLRHSSVHGAGVAAGAEALSQHASVYVRGQGQVGARAEEALPGKGTDKRTMGVDTCTEATHNRNEGIDKRTMLADSGKSARGRKKLFQVFRSQGQQRCVRAHAHARLRSHLASMTSQRPELHGRWWPLTGAAGHGQVPARDGPEAGRCAMVNMRTCSHACMHEARTHAHACMHARSTHARTRAHCRTRSPAPCCACARGQLVLLSSKQAQTGLTPPTSAPELGSPQPTSAPTPGSPRPTSCADTELTPPSSAPGLGSPRPRLRPGPSSPAAPHPRPCQDRRTRICCCLYTGAGFEEQAEL